MDVFERNKRKANSSGVGRFMNDPDYRKELISAAHKAHKSNAIKKRIKLHPQVKRHMDNG